MTQPQAVSAPLADFVVNTTFVDLPARTVHMTQRCLLDAIGVSLAASGLGEGCRAFVDMALEQAGRPSCTVFGTSRMVPAEAAAFANGSMAHAVDYEDAHDVVLLHPNAPTVPAALAIAEAYGPVSGKELITAIAIGCDVAVRLGLALRASLPDFGWYTPPILAAFGATAAAAKLLRLNSREVRDAFSLVLCQATCSGEIKYSPDSVMRAVRDAFVARAAVTSAILASRGVTGFDLPFEGRAGFFAMFARGAYEPADLVRNLGKTFEIENISFKPWPSCRGTHAAIEGVMKLCAQHALDADGVASIRIRGSRILRMLDEPHASKRRPATAIDAKFSLPFTIATALVHGRVTLEEFFPQALTDARVLRAADKVSVEIDPDLPENTIGCHLSVTTYDGVTYDLQVGAPLGDPGKPMTESAFIDKFVDCARYAAEPLDRGQADRVCETVLTLDTVGDIGGQLMPMLRVG